MTIIYRTSEYIVTIYIQLNFCVADNMYLMSSTNTSYMDSCLMSQSTDNLYTRGFCCYKTNFCYSCIVVFYRTHPVRILSL
jgi:hypothetical protein